MRIRHALMLSCAKNGVMPVVFTDWDDIGPYLSDVVRIGDDIWEYGSLRLDLCEVVGGDDDAQ